MILPYPKEAKHKAWLYRLLTEISDNQFLASSIYFKGGTCAAMRGLLDRFSIDLDFDYVAGAGDMEKVGQEMEKIFKRLGLEIKEKSPRVPQYFLKYPAKEGERNTIKIDITFPPPKSNEYETVMFSEIDRIITCQTIETMFANKLVALIDRFERNESIAGRDLYDIHYFFLQEFKYNKRVIAERRKTTVVDFFKELISFIESHITNTIICQDLNFLLTARQFQKIRKFLKKEVLMFLKGEIERLSKNKWNIGR